MREDKYMGIGPQSSSGDSFTRRMRLHQSWYRSEVLHAPYGIGPRPSSKTRYGNMLAAEAAKKGLNFLTPEISALAQRRARENPDDVEPFRLMHNMLSSQPMCFNLFGPLALDHALATRQLRKAFGRHVARVTDVRIEWAPSPRRTFLDDHTSFDAFIEYEHADGTLGFYGIETKLTEPFSQKVYDGPGYRRWMTVDSPWGGAHAGEVTAKGHNQLWRNHLLAWSMLRQLEPCYRHGAVVVVHHPLDERCVHTFAGYEALLRDASTLERCSLDDLTDAWGSAMPGTWDAAFRLRYLDLGKSERAHG